jgi:aspartyl-tRNA(Asn)/glutamyl-tRNA(Gln) amidotransferase subunit A
MTTSETDLLRLDLVSAARAVASGEVDPVALTTAYLDRAAEVDQELNAYVTLTGDQALDDARRARQAVADGRPLGPLHGVPVGVKDLFDTAGTRTTYGSAMYRDHVPAADATVVARLRGAGAVVLGKHATHELAWGGTTTNEHFGTVHNPRDTARIPGGSSGGSAASVVSGTALASVGTDTAGSVRIPAALCGCVGFKPTRGRVSLAGAMPLARSLDHAGPITRTVADAATVLQVIAGADPRDLRTLDDPVPDHLRVVTAGREVPALRVGRLRGWYDALLDPPVRRAVEAVEAVLRAAGHVVVDVPVREADVVTAVFTRLTAEAGALHGRSFSERPEAFGAGISAILSQPPPTPQQVAAAESVLSQQAQTLFEALTTCDVLLCATVPVVAPLIGAQRVAVGPGELPIEWALTRLTSVFDVTGLPALSLPVLEDGWAPLPVLPASAAGALPAGVQLVGRPRDDALVLALGQVVETTLRGGDLR